MKLKTKAKTVRAAARRDLKGYWGQATGVFILMSIIIGIVAFISAKTFLHWIPFVQLLIMAPIIFGGTFYYLHLARKTQVFSNLFNPFTNKKWWKSIVLLIMMEVGTAITSLLLIIAGIIGVIYAVIVGVHSIENAMMLSSVHGGKITGPLASLGLGVFIWFVVIIIFMFILLIPAYIYAFIYCMIIPVALDNPDMGLFKVFKTSRHIMRGNKWRYFRLQWSFFGWNILSTISFGIGFIWIGPYRIAAGIKFYQEIIGEIDLSINNNNGIEVKETMNSEVLVNLEKNSEIN